jgi:predicted peptidase
MNKIFILSFILFLMVQNSSAQNGAKQNKVSSSGNSLNYLIYLPKDYEDKSSKEKWPVIFFLHGSGERGTDLDSVKKNGLPMLVEKTDYPFIVVSPQCPEGERWDPYALNSLYKEILKKYRADKNRVYLTGLSMGGYGTWAWAIESPDKFAAIAPVCGGGDPMMTSIIKNVPVWAFHGLKDNVVLPSESIEMIDALKKSGANPKLTLYPDASHDSWTLTYNNPELYEWFLQHRKN